MIAAWPKISCSQVTFFCFIFVVSVRNVFLFLDMQFHIYMYILAMVYAVAVCAEGVTNLMAYKAALELRNDPNSVW